MADKKKKAAVVSVEPRSAFVEGNSKGKVSAKKEKQEKHGTHQPRDGDALGSMPRQLAEAQTKLESVERQLETAKIEVEKPFAQEAELAEKLDRLSALNALLNMDEKGDGAAGIEDDAAEQAETDASGHDVQKAE